MADIITPEDLPAALQPHEMVGVMLAGLNARASRVAPCLAAAASASSPTESQTDALNEARLVLVGAVRRWVDAGAGSLSAQTAGPFGMTVDTRQRTGYNLWPSEVTALQDICRDVTAGGKAFAIDTLGMGTRHLPWCDLMFNGASCSCGVDIAGYPIYEQG